MNLLSWFNSSTSENTAEKVEPSFNGPDLNIKMDPGNLVTVDMLATRYGTGTVSADSAMKIEAYYSCIRDKAETIGSLPLKLFTQEGENPRREMKQGRSKRIFTERPNEYQSIIEFMEMAAAVLERRGAFYAYAPRNDRGAVMEFIPFRHQGSVVPNMDMNGNVYWTYTLNDGRPQLTIDDRELFRITLFSTDGIHPTNPIYQCANQLGIALAQDKSYKNNQEKGMTTQMGLKTPNQFNDANAVQRLKDDFKKMRGPTGFENIPLFENGLEPVWFQLSSKEQELLGHRQFTIDRICRMTRVPPHRVGFSDKGTTVSDPTKLDEAYMNSGINPILRKFEGEFNRFLPTGMHVQFDRNAFYQGSPWRLGEAIEKQVKAGLVTVNEGRVMLGMEPVDGGDVFGIDNNNVTYGTWDDLPAIQAQLYGGNGTNGGNTNEN
jgi:HK97 family phage portal protein